MKKVLIALSVTLLLFAGSVYANCTGNGCISTIQKLYPTATWGGAIRIQLDATDIADLDCTPNSGVYVVLRKSHSMYWEYYQMMLVADSLVDELYFRIANGSSPCEIQYITTR